MATEGPERPRGRAAGMEDWRYSCRRYRTADFQSSHIRFLSYREQWRFCRRQVTPTAQIGDGNQMWRPSEAYRAGVEPGLSRLDRRIRLASSEQVCQTVLLEATVPAGNALLLEHPLESRAASKTDICTVILFRLCCSVLRILTDYASSLRPRLET